MGLFDVFKKIGGGISKAAGSVVNVVHHIPVVGQGMDLAEKAGKTALGIGSKAIDTAGSVATNQLQSAQNISSGVAGATGALATQVPKVISGAGGAISSVEGAVSKDAPIIIGGLSKAVDGAGGAIQGIGSVSAFLPFIAGGLGLVFLMRSKKI